MSIGERSYRSGSSSLAAALSASIVDATAAVSAHRTFLEDDLLPALLSPLLGSLYCVEAAAMVLFSLVNLSLRLSYWDCKSSIKSGPPPPVLPAVNDPPRFSPDDSPTLGDA